MTEERKAYLKEYRKEKLRRVPVEFRLDYYQRLKNVAELEGTTVTKLIKSVVDTELRRLEKRNGIEPEWNIKVVTGPDGKKKFIRV